MSAMKIKQKKVPEGPLLAIPPHANAYTNVYIVINNPTLLKAVSNCGKASWKFPKALSSPHQS